MVQLMLFLAGSWDESKHGLRDDLEHLQAAINRQQASAFPDGRLQFSSLVAAGGASRLVGRRSGSAGDFEELTLGSGLSMSGTVLSSSGGSGGQSAAQILSEVFLR